jgi:hypothetical protein
MYMHTYLDRLNASCVYEVCFSCAILKVACGLTVLMCCVGVLYCRRVKKVWTALRYRIIAIVLEEALGFRNIVRYTDGRLDLGCYEFDRQHTVLTLVTLCSV